MTKTDDRDFRQFGGTFDTAMAADAAFANRLRKRMQVEGAGSHQSRPTPMIDLPTLSRASTVVPMRRSHPLTVAAAVLIVFAVVVASVWVLGSTSLEGQFGSAPGGNVTIPAEAIGTPGPDVHLSSEPFPGERERSHILGIFDDALLTTEWAQPEYGSGTPTLTAHEISTGEIRWQLDDADIGGLSQSGETLVGIRWRWAPGASHIPETPSLFALNLRTGEVLWEQDVPEGNRDQSGIQWTDPTVIQNQVVLATNTGQLWAWNLATGEITWQETFDAGIGSEQVFRPEGSEAISLPVRSVALTSWNGQVVLANSNGNVLTIDPADGTIVKQSLFALDDDQSFVSTLELSSLPGGVLMIRDKASREVITSELITFNPSSGETQWKRLIPGGTHAEVAANGTIALSTYEWKVTPWYLRLIRQPGYSTAQFTLIDGDTGAEIFSTERERVETNGIAITDGTYTCYPTDEFLCFDQYGTRYILDVIPWWPVILHDGVLYFTIQDGIVTVDLP